MPKFEFPALPTKDVLSEQWWPMRQIPLPQYIAPSPPSLDYDETDSQNSDDCMFDVAWYFDNISKFEKKRKL